MCGSVIFYKFKNFRFMEFGCIGCYKLLFYFKEVIRNLFLDLSVVLFRILYLLDRLCSCDVNLVLVVNKLFLLSLVLCEGYLVIFIDY